MTLLHGALLALLICAFAGLLVGTAAMTDCTIPDRWPPVYPMEPSSAHAKPKRIGFTEAAVLLHGCPD